MEPTTEGSWWSDYVDHIESEVHRWYRLHVGRAKARGIDKASTKLPEVWAAFTDVTFALDGRSREDIDSAMERLHAAITEAKDAAQAGARRGTMAGHQAEEIETSNFRRWARCLGNVAELAKQSIDRPADSHRCELEMARSMAFFPVPTTRMIFEDRAP